MVEAERLKIQVNTVNTYQEAPYATARAGKVSSRLDFRASVEPGLEPVRRAWKPPYGIDWQVGGWVGRQKRPR
jgi:hypothetical protein